MIREAHIGIGLYGNEGLRAVQSSDFALAEFRLLWRLLLVHGRRAYRSNAEMILYFFYKNLVMTFPHYFFAFYCSFSGISLYDSYYIAYYNMVFTAWPLSFRVILEFDVNVEMDGPIIESLIPNLYYLGQSSLVCNNKTFLQWCMLGIAHAAVIFFIPSYAFMTSGIIEKNGTQDELWILSVCSFTSIIWVVNLKLVVLSRSVVVY